MQVLVIEQRNLDEVPSINFDNIVGLNIENNRQQHAAEENLEQRKQCEQKADIDSCNRVCLQSTSSFPGISVILPNLLLSGANVIMPHVLDQLDVRFVINVAPELPDTPLSSQTKPLYLRIPIVDRPNSNLLAYFDEVADMIEEVRQHAGVTLVHCVAGVSRSATLCIAYLMKHASMRLRDAYEHVKAIRSQIRPNSGFFQQLRQYEKQLYDGSSSVAMVFYESLNQEIPDVLEPEYRAMEEFYQRHKNALKNRRSNKLA